MLTRKDVLDILVGEKKKIHLILFGKENNSAY